MPELPEAEYMVRRLREFAPAAEIVRTRILRPGYAAPARVRGRIAGYSRRAKNVLVHLADGRTLRIVLGMTGHVYWVAEKEPALPRFTRVLFELGCGGGIVFEDSRAFGSIGIHKAAQLEAALANYGPEPLDEGFHWQQLRDSAGRVKGPLKPFLLDQSRIAGLGNIWAVESLFRAHLHPARPVNRIVDAEWKALHNAIRRTLSRAIENAFKVTSSPEDFPEADLQWLNVYGREGKACRRCRTPVARTVMGGRSTYFCPACQV